MLGDLKSVEATEFQSRDQRRPLRAEPLDHELVVPEHGTHNCGLHEQLEASCTCPKKGGACSEAAGVDDVSPHLRERKMAVSEAKTRRCG